MVLTFSSCISDHQNEEKDIKVFIKEEIDNALNDGKLYIAYQKYNFYKNQLVSNDYLRIFEDELKLKLKNYKTDNDWLRYKTTLNNLNKLNIETTQLEDDILFYSYISTKDSIDRSDIYAAEKDLPYDKLSMEQLTNLYEQFIKVVDHRDFPKLVDELKQYDYTTEKSSDERNYLNGLLTVYVNNGVKFVNGIGAQDLVVGSGFFIDKQGYAITNHHVISSVVDPENEGITDLYVKLNGSLDKIPCTVVGWDPLFDLALLKIPTIPQYYFSMVEDNNSVGDKVIALGSPGGLGSTVTSGIVSAKDRNLLEMGSVIQIDSAINPGNSGGPLINEDKDVTNVVFAGIEAFEGVNFAIPVKYLLNSLNKLYLGGEINHNWLGIALTERKASLEVIYIQPHSPAYYMGIKKGDILLNVDGLQFESTSEIQDYILTCSEHQLLSVEYKRDGNVESVIIPLVSRPSTAMEHVIKHDTSDHLYIPLFGMDISFSGKLIWDREYQVNDVYPGSIADDLDLNIGDIIEVKKWEYLEEYGAVVLHLVLQSKDEGFWKKTIQITAPIGVNLFI